jgi:DNA-binding transcriptional MerR regulator
MTGDAVTDDAAFIWDQPTRRRRPRPRPATGDDSPSLDGRITLREAERRFGVRVSTLRAWARRGSIDAVKDGSEQWFVTPESIAHHLSRAAPRASAPASTAERASTTGPTEDGSAMLVPRDAWDRLMDQLGNLHEAGLHLAEARERAAKAETEATFLRERLGEMRSERDELKDLIGPPTPPTPAAPSSRSGWDDFRRRYGWLWGRRGS